MTAETQRYGVILADPPWLYEQMSAVIHGAASACYPLMGDAALADLPVPDMAAPSCVLAMWGTWPKLPEAVALMEAWGFTYKTGLPWVKTTPGTGEIRRGIGFWFQSTSEFVLFGVRGEPSPTRGTLGLLSGEERQFYAPITGHSAKPHGLHDYLETFPGPYLELFARRTHPRWQTWGHSTGVELTPDGPRPYAPAETGLFAEGAAR